nr:hypothetical protein [Anaerolineae bacterium]
DFESVLPPPAFDDSQTIICWIDLTKEGYSSSIGITKAIMYPKAAWWDDGIHGDVEYGSSGYTWGWHNGPGSYDLGFDFQEWNGPDIHVYSTGSGWGYPVTGDCNPNLSALP